MGGVAEILTPSKPKLPKKEEKLPEINEGAAAAREAGVVADAAARRRAKYGTLLTRGPRVGSRFKLGG